MFVARSIIIATSEAALPPTSSVACKARFRRNDSPPIYTFRSAPCVAIFLPRARHAEYISGRHLPISRPLPSRRAISHGF